MIMKGSKIKIIEYEIKASHPCVFLVWEAFSVFLVYICKTKKHSFLSSWSSSTFWVLYEKIPLLQVTFKIISRIVL